MFKYMGIKRLYSVGNLAWSLSKWDSSLQSGQTFKFSLFSLELWTAI